MTTSPSTITRTTVPPCEALPEVLATRVGYLLNRAAGKIREMTEEALTPLDITPKHYGLMAVIHSTGPATQHALGEVLKVDRTTMVILVDDAEAKDLVLRGPHPTDRRCHLLSLSEHGEKVFNQAHRLVQKVEDQFFSVLPKDEKEQLIQLLGNLFGAMGGEQSDVQKVLVKS